MLLAAIGAGWLLISPQMTGLTLALQKMHDRKRTTPDRVKHRKEPAPCPTTS